MLTPSITGRTFLVALGILIVSAHPYEVYLRGIDTPLRPTDEPLQPGKYDIKPDSPQGRIFITNELCITRILSQTRDRKCVITGVVNPDRLIALHDWDNYSRWITNREGTRDTGINSCQNGLLMLSHIMKNDNYRIITFSDDVFNVVLDVGEPVFETDFPPGSHMVGEIRNGPDAIKRMEAELFARLGGLSLA
ncbi:hypothetical protein V1527DRAFT_495744 [Lipomyces starkeyi]